MKTKVKENLPIAFILIIAAFLYIFRIWTEGYANSYYAAGVYSMGQNLHAFFFNSLDSVGYVTIDKPPLGFWIQVLFTKVFGFSGGVLVLPEAISGVVSVFLIYRIVKKRFNKAAGLVSAAVLALTPIFAAVMRNNTIDGILILLLVLAADQVLKAVEKSSGKHLVFAGILIGLGFNVKMLQAFMIIPAVYLVYLIFSKQKLAKKILYCALSALILIVISMSWVVVVDLVDEDSRPYVGSSDTNSAVELVFGHNGVSRFLGRGGATSVNRQDDGAQNIQRPPLANNQDDGLLPDGRDGYRRPPQLRNDINQTGDDLQYGNVANQKQGGISGEAGETSFLRLFNDKNAGQISWFLMPALIMSAAALIMVFIKKYRNDEKFPTFFLFSMWVIPMYIYFSFAEGITHRYYFAMLGPGIAALMGIGYYYLSKIKKTAIIPIVFALIAAVQIYIHRLYADWAQWLAYICIGIFAICLVVMIIMVAKKSKPKLIAALMCVLIIMPGVWAASPAIYNDNSQLPIAGPELINQRGSFDNTKRLDGVINYLEENRNGATFLAMTESSMQDGAELILQSGEAVMVLGGFNGGDSTATLEEFIQMVRDNEVVYAVLSQNNNQKSNQEIYQWIVQNAKIIPPRLYGGMVGNLTVYYLGK